MSRKYFKKQSVFDNKIYKPETSNYVEQPEIAAKLIAVESPVGDEVYQLYYGDTFSNFYFIVDSPEKDEFLTSIIKSIYWFNEENYSTLTVDEFNDKFDVENPDGEYNTCHTFNDGTGYKLSYVIYNLIFPPKFLLNSLEYGRLIHTNFITNCITS